MIFHVTQSEQESQMMEVELGTTKYNKSVSKQA